MGRFDGKVALVTGGSRGIGYACAARLAAEGARVALCARDLARAETAAREIGADALAFQCDVAFAEAVDTLVKEVSEALGPIAILVNNAGITRDGLVPRMKEEDWQAVLRTNLDGVFHLCRAAARGMFKQRFGRIINMTSIVGIHGQAGQANYSAAKAAVIGFTKAYAQEAAARNITVNAVAPGYIETGMTADLGESAKDGILQRIPLKRGGTPEDVAGVAAFLASDDAAYITGAVVPVDGGLGM